MVANLAGQDEFVRIGARDNFYQSCAFVPMSFALVTSVSEDGNTAIGPHALCFPFNVTAPYAMMLISRGTSATAGNIRRLGRCALNYIEFDAGHLRAVTRLGYPGQTPEDKRRANPFTLIPSPMPGSAANPAFPRIIREAFQVFECTWDKAVDLSMPGDVPSPDGAGKFVLRIDNILLKQRFRDGVEQGRHFPNMPIFMGFRAGGEFWFAEHDQPFAVAAPKVPGTEVQAIAYLANRLDEHVRFTEAACARLTQVPRPFLQAALEGIIAAARARGAVEVTAELVDSINKDRNAG